VDLNQRHIEGEHDMNAVAENIDIELREAEARVQKAAEPLDAAQAERRRLFVIANEADHEAAEAERRREPLLLKSFRGDDQAAGLLAQITPHVAALRERAQNARDAAALLEPDIKTLGIEVQRAARAIMDIRHQRLVEVAERSAKRYAEALETIWPAVAAYVEAKEHCERSSRVLTGEVSGHFRDTPPAFKAARYLSIQAHKFFGAGHAGQALEMIFQEGDGEL
jgi:hypothetical protein